MTALREIFARFGVQFDRGPLAAGNAEVTRSTRGLGALSGAARQVSGAIASMGATLAASLTVGKLVSVVRSTLDEAAALNMWSRRLQMGTRDLDAWNRVGVNFRVNADQMGAALNRLRVGAGGAIAGIGRFKVIFETAGISMDRLRAAGGDTTQLMLLASDAIRSIEDPATKAAIAERLLGGEAATLLPLLEAGREEILAQRDAAMRGNESIEQLTRATSGIRREQREANERWRALRIEFVTRLAPALERGARIMGDVVEAFTNTARSSHLLEVAITALGGAAVAAAAATIGAWGPVVLPIALAAAAVALLVLAIDDLIVTAEGGDSVLRRFLEWVEGADRAAQSVRQLQQAIDDLRMAWEWVQGALGLEAPDMTTREGQARQRGRNAREVMTSATPNMTAFRQRQEWNLATTQQRTERLRWRNERPEGTGARLLTPAARAEVAAAEVARTTVSAPRSTTVHAPMDVRVTVNAATDAAEVDRRVRTAIREAGEEQRREILGAVDEEVPEMLAR